MKLAESVTVIRLVAPAVPDPKNVTVWHVNFPAQVLEPRNITNEDAPSMIPELETLAVERNVQLPVTVPPRMLALLKAH